MTTTDLTLTFETHPLNPLVDIEGTAWFFAKEACAILETRVDNIRSILEESEVASLKELQLEPQNPWNEANPYTIGVGKNGGRPPLLVSEAGLYHLINVSRKPVAKPFQHWVNHIVLPMIRRTGRYVPEQPDTANELSKDDVIHALAEANHELTKSNAALRGALQEVTHLLSSRKGNRSKSPQHGDDDKRTPAERWYLQQIHELGYVVPGDCPFPESMTAHKAMIDRFGLKTSTRRILREGCAKKQVTRILLPTSLTPEP